MTFTLPEQCNATCPACGLLCDDVVVETQSNQTQAIKNGCKKSQVFFAQARTSPSPRVGGKITTLDQAITHVAHILRQAKYPLFEGLSTDVSGFRTLFALAQKTRAHLQHFNHASITRNMLVLQSSGWQTTTLAEVKNRADVIVCFGDIPAHNPRFFERFVDLDGLFVTAENRQVFWVGEAEKSINIQSPATGLNHSSAGLQAALRLACKADDLPSVTIALRALIAGKTLKVNEIAGIKLTDLQKLADTLNAAKYAVLAWVAKDFDFPHAELSIENITQTVALLNQTTRAAGLLLGGSDGDTSVNYAHTWLNGHILPSPTTHTPDARLWINSFSPDKSPPNDGLPTIVLGHPDSAFSHTPAVFIPIATPGLDCGGTLFRIDGSVALPLKKIRDSDLPTLADVIRQIEAQL